MKDERIPDKSKAPGESEVHYRRGEGYKKRHARRYQHANLSTEAVKEWCEVMGITLRITNEGHHWTFRHGKQIAEWWPSTAKFVFDKHWQEGIHTHSKMQVLDLLSNRWFKS